MIKDTISDVIVSSLRRLHEPEAINNAMVYEVWNDGEITLTKGGDLYRQRSLHSICAPIATGLLPVDSLFVSGKFSRICCSTHDKAIKAQSIFNLIK